MSYDRSMAYKKHQSKYKWIKKGNKNAENILRNISEIKFQSLIRVNITQNNISTIEGLNKIFMPQLRAIFLSNKIFMMVGEKINKITDLVKVKWPCLQILSLRT